MSVLVYVLYYPYFSPCIFSILACGIPLPQQQIHHKDCDDTVVACSTQG